jgi:hypothetical protein
MSLAALPFSVVGCGGSNFCTSDVGTTCLAEEDERFNLGID